METLRKKGCIQIDIKLIERMKLMRKATGISITRQAEESLKGFLSRAEKADREK